MDVSSTVPEEPEDTAERATAGVVGTAFEL
jgi:hypothetical protein